MRRHLHPHRDPKLNDVAGVLSSSPAREAFKNDHGRRIALYISRVRHLALEWHAGGRRAQANLRRSAAADSFLFGALRARFLGAGLLLAGMRVLPGGDRLRVRG
jgi:hypothetical protein